MNDKAFVRMMESYSGPHPHPDHLERYERLCPGSAQLIFDEFRLQGAHRRELEKEIVQGNEKRAARGQWMGFGVAILFLAVAAWLVLAGFPLAGTVLGTVDIVSLVAVFVVGKYHRNGSGEE